MIATQEVQKAVFLHKFGTKDGLKDGLKKNAYERA